MNYQQNGIKTFLFMKQGKVLQHVHHLVKLLNAIAKNVPSLFGGSADLSWFK